MWANPKVSNTKRPADD
ncbi:Protein of unknown function [Weissella confusa LBAE C39-2]|nr:Protein of unknown function [Weissella confusa LBAE C39-2]